MDRGFVARPEVQRAVAAEESQLHVCGGDHTHTWYRREYGDLQPGGGAVAAPVAVRRARPAGSAVGKKAQPDSVSKLQRLAGTGAILRGDGLDSQTDTQSHGRRQAGVAARADGQLEFLPPARRTATTRPPVYSRRRPPRRGAHGAAQRWVVEGSVRRRSWRHRQEANVRWRAVRSDRGVTAGV